MGRIRSLVVMLVLLHFSGQVIRAESPIDVLEQELKDAQQQHDEVSSKQFSDFISALDAAIQSPDQALALYQNAGGQMPSPAPVITANISETPDEKALRLAQDQAVDAALASLIQLHCGVMRFAANFIQSPDQKGLHDSWVAWLKQAAQSYPQAGIIPPDNRTNAQNAGDENQRGNGWQGARRRGPGPPQDYARALKEKAVRDSVISSYLSYRGWGGKEQGSWAVRDIPRLYRAEILDPLRANPNAATLAAWDTYIAMKNTDEPDAATWNTVDYPPLQFERGSDAFYAGPSEETLSVLVKLISDNPTNPDTDNWIARVKQMIQDYRTFKSTGTLPRPNSGGSTNAPPAAPAGT